MTSRSTDFSMCLSEKSPVCFKMDSSHFSCEVLEGKEEQWSPLVLGHKAVLLPLEEGRQGGLCTGGRRGQAG